MRLGINAIYHRSDPLRCVRTTAGFHCSRSSISITSILEVQPQFRTHPKNLRDIYLKSTTGTSVPLSAFTSFSNSTAPILISHIGQFPATTISFNLAPHAALGEAGNCQCGWWFKLRSDLNALQRYKVPVVDLNKCHEVGTSSELRVLAKTNMMLD